MARGLTQEATIEEKKAESGEEQKSDEEMLE
jgi:hypothetical protein